MQPTAIVTGDKQQSGDLGPLAWVLDELRKSLDGASKAIKRFVRDAELARGSDLESLDASQLRIARQQLHQAVGALEMVGLPEPAKVLRAMEALAQKFVQRPEGCSDEAAGKIERAGFALVEYLESTLRGKAVSAVALFPQYRDVLELVGEERIHPADLWPHSWRWIDMAVPGEAQAIPYDPSVRREMDMAVLKVVKSASKSAAQVLRNISLGLAHAQETTQTRSFWKISAGFFDALASGLCEADVYVKRVASKVLMQYNTLSKGQNDLSERLAQDMLFFCAQTKPADVQLAPVLAAVRQAYGLPNATAVNYEVSVYGRFDPAVLAQARKRISNAAETWSALSGGDTNRLKVVGDHFTQVADSLLKLSPENKELVRGLSKAIEVTVRSGEPPSTPLAMEVATSILYLDAAYEDIDPTDTSMRERSERLARRLDHVIAGGQPEALEPWMEELYRRVSDRQTMGSVVEELRTSLTEIEKSLDQFFRNPNDKAPLNAVPGQLAQMRGVFSVLGLDQASLATVRMRDQVEKFLVDNVDEAAIRSGAFEKFGNSLGALGFLIDMLSYQRTLAKKLFVYDEALGEFKPLMGRERDAAVATPEEPVVAPVSAPAPAPATAVAPAAPVSRAQATAAAAPRPAAPAPAPKAPEPALDDDGAELRDIFLEEAREVVRNGGEALEALIDDPADLAQQTTLRRAFHTLKGSSRMVGLTEFGEAGWAMEQMMNNWLAEQKPIRPELLQLAGAAMQEFGRWVEDIARGTDAGRSAAAFRKCGDAMRLEGKLIPLDTVLAQELSNTPVRTEPAPLAAVAAPVAKPIPLASPTPAPSSRAPAAADAGLEFKLDDLPVLATDATKKKSEPVLEAASAGFSGIDFDSLSQLEPAAPPQPASGPQPEAELDIDWAAVASTTQEPKRTEPVFELAQPAGQSMEFNGLNLDLSSGQPDWSQTETAPIAAEAPQDVVTHQGALDIGDFSLDLDSLASPPDAVVEAEVAVEPAEEQVKVIESLRISIPLYNVFLNEADEWSRRLVTELAEWALETHRPIADSSIALAHSLGGSSATVGFVALSEIARALEAAMQHVQLHPSVQPEQVQTLVAAADEIRHLLHQFAAGFLKEPDPRLLANLQAIERGDWSSSTSAAATLEVPAMPAQDYAELDLNGLSAELDLQPVQTPPEPAPLNMSFELPDIDLELGRPKELEATAPATHLGAQELEQFQEPVWQPEQVQLPEPVQEVLASGAIDQAGLVSADERPSAMPGAARIVLGDDEDEIDATDAIDPDLFPIFEEEATELMPQLASALRQWAAQPDNQRARLDVLRTLHTLKGSARLAGAMRLGEMAHRMETAIEQMGNENLQVDQVEPMLGRYDRLQQTFDALCHGPAPEQDAETISPPLAAHAPELVLAMPVEPVGAPLLADLDFPNQAPAPLVPSPASLKEQPAVMAKPVSKPSMPSPQPVRAAAATATGRRPALALGQTVRVRSQLLDRLVNQAGEVMITRSRLDGRLNQLTGSLNELTVNLDRLRTHLRDVEVQAESQMQSRLAQAKDTAQGFDPLEFDRFTRVQELTRMMAESVNDVATVQRNLQQTISGTEDDLIEQARQARELQRDLLRTRMMEFESISERLYGVVRQAAKDAGKQVKLDIVGGNLEIDRGVLDRMAPAFEHMLRNAVAHGIENPEQRAAAGKSPAGTITIGLHHEGNDVSITFGDDGAGLNLARIREKAAAQKLTEPGQLLSDDEAANMIFMPGFSTAANVTELAGRGIGMDVVRSEVQALGGRIETSTQAGVGTSFKLVLPLTTAVTQVIMLRLGELNIGVPASLVEIVRRLNTAELERAYQVGSIDYGGESVPFFWSGALLQASARSQETMGKTQPVVVLRSAGQRVAMHVDEVLGNQEVVVKNLGPQLSRLPGLSGMSVLASGAVVLIYNPVALAAVYGYKAHELQQGTTKLQVASILSKAASQGEQPALGGASDVPLVLVVDDSITVRRVTQRLLRREGYRVALAADGLQALERLAEERPAVVLSDIEMPRMDGFDLARNIRADAKLRDLPIIMITSRIAEKHRDHAMELGVNHYLGKPFSEEELLALVRQYSNQTAAA